MAKLFQGWAGWAVAGAALIALFGLSVWGLTRGQSDAGGEAALSAASTAQTEMPDGTPGATTTAAAPQAPAETAPENTPPAEAADQDEQTPVAADQGALPPPAQGDGEGAAGDDARAMQTDGSERAALGRELEADPTAQSAQGAAPDPGGAPTLPSFDVVRVAPDGGAIIAGLAAPGAIVRIMISGLAAYETQADGAGNFVAMFDLPSSAEPRDLWLQSEANGFVGASAETLLIEPSAAVSAVAIPQPAGESAAADPGAKTQGAPKLVLAGPEGAKVVQDDPPPSASGGPLIAPLSVDSIAYDAQGEVALSGRASGPVRVYLDDAPVGLADVAQGQWRLPLPKDVGAGVYTLRVDEVTATGKVSARVETPFKREDAAVLAQTASQSGDAGNARATAITVQPGATLWAISEAQYGDGLRYVQVFAANRDLIRDPDLIYPGQVFALPK